MRESKLREHLKSTPQQRLIKAAFAIYKRKCEEQRYPMHLNGVDAVGADLLFEGGNLGAHIGFSVGELAEFMQYMAKTHTLYAPGETRFFIALNGERWEAFQEDTMEACVKRVDEFYEAARREYEASPKYVEDTARAAAEEAANFTRCNHVAHKLDIGFDSYDVASWVETFVEVSQHRGALMATDAQMIFNRFQTMGYEVSEGVGTEPKTFEERVRYIVGQVMSYCQKGWPPHPMLATFAKKAIKDHLEPTNEQPASES